MVHIAPLLRSAPPIRVRCPDRRVSSALRRSPDRRHSLGNRRGTSLRSMVLRNVLMFYTVYIFVCIHTPPDIVFLHGV